MCYSFTVVATAQTQDTFIQSVRKKKPECFLDFFHVLKRKHLVIQSLKPAAAYYKLELIIEKGQLREINRSMWRRLSRYCASVLICSVQTQHVCVITRLISKVVLEALMIKANLLAN